MQKPQVFGPGGLPEAHSIYIWSSIQSNNARDVFLILSGHRFGR
jgi:hypothetical protein